MGGGNYDLTDPDLGSMVGEISPNIMFCQTKAKWVQTALDGCAGVRMGTIGCIFTGKQENKEKWGGNQRSGHILQVWSRITDKKTTRSWQVWSRGSERIQRGNNGRATGSRCDIVDYKQEQRKKTNNALRKNENEHVQIDVTRWFTQPKKQSLNRAKKNTK